MYNCAMKKAADRCAQNRPAIEHLFKELNIGSKTSQGSPVYRAWHCEQQLRCVRFSADRRKMNGD